MMNNYIEVKELIELFEKANYLFLKNEKELILFGVSERCVCATLMYYIRRELEKKVDYIGYYADVEYNRIHISNRKNMIKSFGGGLLGGKRKNNFVCDLIVHSRGNKKIDNLIALEMKKSISKEQCKLDDINRLKLLTSEKNIDNNNLRYATNYILGIYYEINTDKSKIGIKYYNKGRIYKDIIINLDKEYPQDV